MSAWKLSGDTTVSPALFKGARRAAPFDSVGNIDLVRFFPFDFAQGQNDRIKNGQHHHCDHAG